jgi:hypothetical protein
MKTTLSSARGLSLVEVTIMLLVLMLLTSVLAPSIFDFVNDAKWVKVKEDCEAIGVSVARLTRDVGPCLKFDGNKRCTMDNRVDLLYSDGPDVTTVDTDGDGAGTFSLSYALAGPLGWWKESERGDSMDNQFVTNGTGPDYPTPNELSTYTAVGPQFNLGWRGAYLSSPIGPDPWGHRYLVNSVFLSVAVDAHVGTWEGKRSGGWSHDTFCLSAGPNGLYETGFGSNASRGVNRQADDFIYIISGDTR